MRQEEFNNIIDLLDTDEHFGITVYDLTKGVSTIECNKAKENIIEKYGSLTNFFNGLFSNGVTEIGIQPLRKNGKRSGTIQNWIKHPKYEYLKVNLTPSEVQLQNAPVQSNPVQQFAPVQQYQTSAPVQYSQPLNGPGMLNGIDEKTLEVYADARDKKVIQVENKFLKEKNDALEDKIREYKDKELKWNNSNASAEQNATLVGAFIQNMDKLPGLIGALKGQGAIAPAIDLGLGNPANLSEEKLALLEVVKVADNNTAYILYRTYDELAKSVEFGTEFNELLKKYNIINDGNS
jgi:hypothetical protein